MSVLAAGEAVREQRVRDGRSGGEIEPAGQELTAATLEGHPLTPDAHAAERTSGHELQDSGR
jgi:hypothetical protein